MELEPGLIEKLTAEYPAVDVLSLSEGLESAANPNAVLIYRTKKAALRSTGKPDPERPSFVSHAGYWNAEGDWKYTGDESDYWDAPSGSVTRGVRQLVWLRRNRDLTPKRAAVDIESRPSLHRAFPSRERWLDCESWVTAPITTSAEAAVRNAGNATFPHPIGGRPPSPELESSMRQLGFEPEP